MFNLKSEVWMGDEASLRQLLALEASALVKAGTVLRPPAANANGGEQLPRLYSRSGNVGVVTIRGGLLNSESWFTEMLGISTYPAIREAMVFAAQDDSIDQVLLDIESPGGLVSGVNDTSNLIREVRGVKPVTAFSDGLLASAAYWLGSAAGKVFVGETAIVGSIGVISTIVSEHDALKKDGIDVRVIRSGKNKALGHPAEPISDKAVKQVQDRADKIYEIFTATVMANRSKLTVKNEDTWAQGNEFLGEDAVKAGLADAISTFDRVLSQLTVDKPNSLNNNPANKKRDLKMPRAALDPKLVAKLSQGATLTAEEQAALDADKAAATAEATAQEAADKLAADAAKVLADKAAADKVIADKAAADKADADAKAALATDKSKSDLVSYLEKQVEAKSAELAAANTKAAAAEAQVAAMKPAHDALVTIATDSLNKMTIALGGKESKFVGTAQDLVAAHAAKLEDFKKAFPVGGVAATAPELKDKPSQVSASVTSLGAARLRMSRITSQEEK